MMSIFDRFKINRKSSAEIAKQRLQIIVAHERAQRTGNQQVDLHELQQKLIRVIADYLKIEEAQVREQVTVELKRDQDRSILELDVTLPDRV